MNCWLTSESIFLYIFKILLYFLYLSKISYISSQNPIILQNYEKKSWIFNIEWKFHINITNRVYASRVTSDSIFLYFSYIFKILLYFLYLSKISYITSQNPIFFQNYEKNSWYRPLNIVFKMYYPKPRNRYWVADHYKNGHVPQKTTILK
jgi:hypothetical protein